MPEFSCLSSRISGKSFWPAAKTTRRANKMNRKIERARRWAQKESEWGNRQWQWQRRGGEEGGGGVFVEASIVAHHFWPTKSCSGDCFQRLASISCRSCWLLLLISFITKLIFVLGFFGLLTRGVCVCVWALGRGSRCCCYYCCGIHWSGQFCVQIVWVVSEHR